MLSMERATASWSPAAIAPCAGQLPAYAIEGAPGIIPALPKASPPMGTNMR